MQDNKVIIENGLTVSIDWVSFTIFDTDYTADDVICFMGFDLCNFRDMPSGANGYKHMKKYEDISVLYDGAENMGVHVNITGSSVSALLESYEKTLIMDCPFGTAYNLWLETVLMHFFKAVLNIGHFTRIDLAVDDIGANFYSLDDILKKQERGLIVSKWKTYQNLTECDISSNEKIGHTIYYGSRKGQSEILMRIYDKQLERNKNLRPDDEGYIVSPWVRWELELKKDRADGVALKLSNGLSLGDVAIGVLYNYFRIIKPDDCNKSRCSDDDIYSRFVNGVRRLHITVSRVIKSMDERRKQFEHQHGREIARYYFLKNCDPSYFPELAWRYSCKLDQEEREQLDMDIWENLL